MSQIEINAIPRDHEYDGYLWMSNAKEPDILEHKPLPDDFLNSVNPFVVEAELWDADEHKSYAIYQAGNQTVCQCYDVKEADFKSPDVDEAIYASHRMNGRGLRFLEYWEEDLTADGVKTEGACLDMPSLVMSRRVFVGFKTKEDHV